MLLLSLLQQRQNWLFDKIGFTLRLSSIKKESKTGHNITQDTLVFKVEFLPEACRPLGPHPSGSSSVPTVCISSPSQAECTHFPWLFKFLLRQPEGKVLLLCMCSISSCLGTHLFLRWLVLEITTPFRGARSSQGYGLIDFSTATKTKIRYSDLDIQKEYTSPLASSSALVLAPHQLSPVRRRLPLNSWPQSFPLLQVHNPKVQNIIIYGFSNQLGLERLFTLLKNY